MLFSDRPRSHYLAAPIHEVICQLRFPTILSINSVEPAAFQEVIRGAFPQYLRRQDVAASKLPTPGVSAPPTEQSPQIVNYNFISADNIWKLNLTEGFIALSTLRYPGWEAFARQLDKPLAAFIKLYQPAYFQRVGLRYVNIVSRKKLGLEESPWTELFTPAYTAPMQEEDVTPGSVLGCACDLTLKLDSSCQAKIHAGTGQVKPILPGAQPDPEEKFIFDMDLSMGSKVPCTLAAGALETLHGHSTRLFEGAVTDLLRGAMAPD